MTPLDEAIEELTAMTRLGAIPEQQRRILGDVIGKIRMHRNEVSDLQKEGDQLRDENKAWQAVKTPPARVLYAHILQSRYDAHREALKEMIDCTLDEVCGPSVTLPALRQFAHKLKEEFFEESE